MVSISQCCYEVIRLAQYATRFRNLTLAPVAQLDRVPGFEPVGCVFESRRARIIMPR